MGFLKFSLGKSTFIFVFSKMKKWNIIYCDKILENNFKALDYPLTLFTKSYLFIPFHFITDPSRLSAFTTNKLNIGNINGSFFFYNLPFLTLFFCSRMFFNFIYLLNKFFLGCITFKFYAGFAWIIIKFRIKSRIQRR